MIARLKSWWMGLSTREHLLLSVLAALLIGVVGYYGILSPLADGRAQARDDIRRYEMLSARLQAAGSLVQPGSQVAQFPGTPIEGAQAAAQSLGLTPALAQNGDAIVGTLIDAPYGEVLKWIMAVEQSTPLRASKVDVTRGQADGLISGSVEFRP